MGVCVCVCVWVHMWGICGVSVYVRVECICRGMCTWKGIWVYRGYVCIYGGVYMGRCLGV